MITDGKKSLNVVYGWIEVDSTDVDDGEGVIEQQAYFEEEIVR